MEDRVLQERGNTLEEEFFRKQNAELLAKLKATKDQDNEERDMTAAIGVDDPALIAQLRSFGVTPATLSAVALAPLVLVAWADRSLDEKERAAVMKEASANGVQPGSPGHDLLQNWLNEAPDASLMTAWSSYARGVADALEGTQRAEFRDSILGRAKAVAGAAGGFAGMGKVSDSEKRVLEQLERALG